MIEKLALENILFLDIETVPVIYKYNDLGTYEKQLWDNKISFQKKEGVTEADLYEKAGIFAEFGKIICVSTAIVYAENDTKKVKVKSFYGHDEKKILNEFCNLLHSHFNKKQHYLCAHNGREFDFPYLCRRILINGIKLPNILNVGGKKQWEINFLDTMELWRFGDYKNFTSLELLAHVFGIPSPKNDIKGSDVKRVYYEEGDIERISEYCKRDALTVARLFLKYRGDIEISEEDIIFV